MSAEDNVKIIQTMYEAFGRGDVGAIVERLADDDLDWGAEATSTGAPWYGVCRSKDDVRNFFTAFASAVDVEEFVPFSMAAEGDDVFAIVRFRGKSRATGKPITMNLHHYFTLRDGKVVFYRGSEDTAQVVAALRS